MGTCLQKTKVTSVCFVALDATEDWIDDPIHLSIIHETDTFKFTSLQKRDTFQIPISKDSSLVAFVIEGRNYNPQKITDQFLTADDTLIVVSNLQPIVPSEKYLKRVRQIEDWRKMWNERILDYPNVYDSLGQELEFLELEKNN